ncbi:tetratricopeptide repeat protein [bacterium]|nr:tetratricopeptide repeat protein [bacterium]MBU1073162.1 tetratricopeptide repeat protein [bacterium]MBU1676330.1 tetratricopeptide repeat protein [bacterium]
MKRRLALVALFGALAAAPGCDKRPVRQAVRLDTLRQHEQYTLVHTVASGETLRTVADLYYGDPARAAEIAAANGLTDPDRLSVGDDLLLVFSEDEWAGAERRYRARPPYNRGVDALASGRLEEAERAFDEALGIDPAFDDARYNQALVQLRRGRNEAAEDLLVDVRSRRPGDQDVLAALGNSLFYQTRFAEAVAVFRELLGLEPRHRQGAYGLARALTEAGMIESAITAWEDYLRLDGDSAWATRAREQLKLLRGG